MTHIKGWTFIIMCIIINATLTELGILVYEKEKNNLWKTILK